MGKIEKFDIVLDEGKQIYHPGDELAGHVIITINEPIFTFGIDIAFRGFSNVSFESLDYYSGELRIYASSEQYFVETYNLLKSDDKPIRLDAGNHSFQFKYRLLANMPSSFEGEFGHVRYTVKSCIKRKCANDDISKITFTVVNELDLAKIEKAEMPLFGTDLVTEASLCYCERGAIIAEIRLAKRAFVPGEIICIYAKVCNSTQYLVYCEVQLCQIVLFRTPGKNKESRRVIASLRHEILDVDDTDVWDGDKLLVPPVPPSFLNACNIIDVHYSVVLKTSADSHKRMEMTIPLEITIGSKPIDGPRSPGHYTSVIQGRGHPKRPLFNYNNTASPVKTPDNYSIVPCIQGPKASDWTSPRRLATLYAEYDVTSNQVINTLD